MPGGAGAGTTTNDAAPEPYVDSVGAHVTGLALTMAWAAGDSRSMASRTKPAMTNGRGQRAVRDPVFMIDPPGRLSLFTSAAERET